MTIGYIMNTYPLVSTTFIGREIAALERLGMTVRRYAIRQWNGDLIDPGDRAEQAKTDYLLGNNIRLVVCLVGTVLRSPRRFLSALGLTFRLMKNAQGGVVRHIAYLAEASVLADLTKRDGITHLHAHFSVNSTTVAMLAQVLGGPKYSFTVHGPDELLAPQQNSTCEKVARAAFVACISHFARSQVMLFSDEAHWNKLQIVHCGVVPADYGQREHGAFGKRILFIGRLVAVKGVPLLLEAVAAAKLKHPDLRLTIVGDGRDRQKREAQAALLKLGTSVNFTGYQDQAAVAALLERSDILVLPSFAEGVPVVLMEAMASRLPVIASRIAGIPELVEDGVSGFLVPPGNVEELAKKLSALLSDPALCARMGLAGRAKVEKEFAVDQEAAKLARLFGVEAQATVQETRAEVVE